MKRDSKMLILISSLVFFAVSCGIPNYFGEVSKYVSFSSDMLEIEDKSYSDGFNSSDIYPKLMFLYTVYDDTIFYDDISPSTITKDLKATFESASLLNQDNFKRWPSTTTSLCSSSIKGTKKSHDFSLYQFAVIDGNSLISSTLPVDGGDDYLFSPKNVNFELNHKYRFDYSVEIDEEDGSQCIVISVIDTTTYPEKMMASYKLGYFGKNGSINSFPLSYNSDMEAPFDKVSSNPEVSILAVLYLQSEIYNNTIMKVDWIKKPLKLY